MDNRRKTIVVNKPFQYQYSLLVVALAVLGTNLFLIIRMLVPGSQPFDLSSSAALILGLAELALIAAVWFGSLKYTHRVAGPVFVFHREICRLGDGDLLASINLRDRDMFREEARAMDKSLADLRARVARLKSLGSELRSAADQDRAAIIVALNAELDDFKVEAGS